MARARYAGLGYKLMQRGRVSRRHVGDGLRMAERRTSGERESSGFSRPRVIQREAAEKAARNGWSSGHRKRFANAHFRTDYAQKKTALREGGLKE